MKKFLVTLILCISNIICYGQFTFNETNHNNYEKVCSIYFNECIYLNLDDSTYIYNIPGNYYIYDFGLDKMAPTYTFKLIFNSKNDLEEFILTIKNIYDNCNDYRGQQITFQNNGEIYKIHAPSSKMSVPYITLSNIVWLNGRQHRNNEAGYVLGYIQAPVLMKKINKALKNY